MTTCMLDHSIVNCVGELMPVMNVYCSCKLELVIALDSDKAV
jgi:hypothetical protein